MFQNLFQGQGNYPYYNMTPMYPQMQMPQMRMPQQQMPQQRQMQQRQAPQFQGPQNRQQPQQQQQQQPRTNDPMVKFEPLDEKTMANLNLKNFSQTPEKSQKPAEESVTFSGFDPIISKKIGDFIQNEKNAISYYNNLADQSPPAHRDTLRRIGDTSKKQVALYSDIYIKYKGNSFEPKEEEVQKNIPFNDGIKMAILEENRQLNELNDIFDLVYDEKNLKALNSLMHKKVNQITNLYLINNMGMM